MRLGYREPFRSTVIRETAAATSVSSPSRDINGGSGRDVIIVPFRKNGRGLPIYLDAQLLKAWIIT